ncbi:SUMF1/EgtB/PvdO family nonheme iron enzyme [Tundrisphaera sp. TA3]|uniref:bifunctional serine/threonine-protein kinase/formylglycine-generating enzyme family protein n=1 Tax=Tundrisphaera sp. TA3 TaxID=3435775 RepID=UPI003EB881E8
MGSSDEFTSPFDRPWGSPDWAPHVPGEGRPAPADPFPTRTSAEFGPGAADAPPTAADQARPSTGPGGASSQRDALTPIGPLAPGQVIFGRYQIEKKLGEGGMGSVWLVRHLALDTHRAIKLIVPRHAFDQNALSRFRREARVMARLSHPNAVAVHDAHVAPDAAFIEMAYVQGESLDRILKPGVPQALDWIARILAQLCDVLQAAHDLSIIHRDLKPSNLILVAGRPPGREILKVLDFGIAKILDSQDREEFQTGTGGAGFTPTYASPQQVLGESVDGRSDLYSIGVILYEFLTGHRPFGGPIIRLYHDLINTPPPPFAAKAPGLDLPKGLEAVVLRCLAKSPEDRPQSPRALWEAFLAALPASFAPTESYAALSGLAAPPAFTPPETVDSPPPRLETTQGDEPGRRDPSPTTRPAEDPSTAVPPTRPVEAKRHRKLVLGLACLAALLIYPVWVMFGPGSGAKRPNEANTTISPDVLSPPIEITSIDGRPGPVGPAAPARPGPARVRYRSEDRGLMLASEAGNGLREPGSIRLARIEGGEFVMGDFADSGPDTRDDRPAHRVRLSPFYLQTTEVTYGQMTAFFRERGIGPGDQPPAWRDGWAELTDRSHLPESEAMEYPAVGIDRRLAEEFAAWAGGRLPTEAEWEYAARSLGQERRFVWGDDGAGITSLARVDSLDEPVPTAKPGSYRDDRTAQGIFDLAGNVREWCSDAWGPYLATSSRVDDPKGPRCDDSNCLGVVRGGSFKSGQDQAGTTFRASEPAATAANDLGFRIVVDAPAGTASGPGLPDRQD